MTAIAQSAVPAGYDVDFIIAQLTNPSVFGRVPAPNGDTLISYDGNDFAKIQAAIASYPTDYLTVALPKKLNAISAERDRRILSFTFGGMTIPLDDTTLIKLDGAALGLMRNTDVTSIDWSLGGGQFVPIPRDTMLALADGAFRHVQLMFSKHRALATAAQAAADINALAAIDETSDASWT